MPVSSTPMPPRAPIGQLSLPSAKVASFQNQGTVGALNAGLPGDVASLSPTQIALGEAAKQKSAVQLSASNRINSIKESNKRMASLAQQVAAKKAQSVGTGTSQNGGIGRAWTQDGNLSAARNQALSKASSLIGTPYVWGGKSAKGIDCGGLVMMAYSQLGVLGNYTNTRRIANIPGVRTSLANLRPGDLVAWKDGSHIAVYAGNGEIIEAANPRRGTLRRKLWASPSAVYGIALRLPGE